MTETVPQTPPQTVERIYRRNFSIFTIDGILFSVAMGILGSTTVIPDFMRHLTNSEILIGLSGSLFDIGWTMPQLFIARYIVRFERKKWWFVGPNMVVRLTMLLFAVIVVLLGKDRPEIILVAFLFAYGFIGFGDGFVGVPWVDLMGSSLNDRWRARVFGIMNAIYGLIMLGVTPLIGLALGSPALAFPNNYALLFGAAGALFTLSIIPGIFIHELPGGKAVEKTPSFGEFLPQLGRVLRTDGEFRAMIAVRMLTSLFAMAGPFYIGFATVQLKLSDQVAVPGLLAMQTIGLMVGSLAYARLGARDNVRYIRLALSGVLLLPVCALLASAVGPLPLYLGFLIAGLCQSNLFFSYQNWVVSHAHADQRPIYAGLFNTLSAVVSLTVPFIAGTIAGQVGYEALFAVALVMGVCALFVVYRYIKPTPVEPAAGLAAAD